MEYDGWAQAMFDKLKARADMADELAAIAEIADEQANWIADVSAEMEYDASAKQRFTARRQRIRAALAKYDALKEGE